MDVLHQMVLYQSCLTLISNRYTSEGINGEIPPTEDALLMKTRAPILLAHCAEHFISTC